MRTFAAAVLAGTSLLSAQERPRPQPPLPVRVDTVVATVNDAAIMLSKLRTLAAGPLRDLARRLDRKLRDTEVQAAFEAERDKLIDKHAMAQAAKTFGIATPEQVEEYFRDEMKREEEEQVRDLGTYQEVSRELERQGRTWQTYYREQRVEKMYLLADEFAVGMRMQKQSNLFLTPRMLRDTYRENIELFVHGEAAYLVVLHFTGTNARSHAEQARALWKDELTPTDLLAQIPGATARITQFGPIDDKSREALAAELVDFAIAGPQGQVSQPLAIGDGIVVARIVDYRPKRHGQFEDPEVQLELRFIARGKVIAEFREQALRRALDRTEVWKNETLR